jgi:UDP-N-acetyl-D-glucosamine dehydrogenase
MVEAYRPLLEKIASGEATVSVLGMGYVGLPLALELSGRFRTLGYDIEKAKIDRLKEGRSYIDDIPDRRLRRHLGKKFLPTNEMTDMIGSDFFIICVPTPLVHDHKPDLSFIWTASKLISRLIQKGAFVILESTTYPGTTEEVVGPVIEKSGLRAGADFGLAFSPERVDPGNKKWNIRNTPKIVGGISPLCTEICEKLYGSVISARIVRVSDPKTAEAAKLVENIFRATNIALVNELALIFEKMDIDTWEVIEAAATKPFSFMAHHPGPGVGGHCIPLDPFYMSYRAEQFGIIPRFIHQAGVINEYMRTHVVNLVRKGLAAKHKKLMGSRILVLGAAYKKNISDTRESPAVSIIEELNTLGAHTAYYDPFVPELRTREGLLKCVELGGDYVRSADAAIIATGHDVFRNINQLKLKDDAVIVDCFNLLGNVKTKWPVIFLGKPSPDNRPVKPSKK